MNFLFPQAWYFLPVVFLPLVFFFFFRYRSDSIQLPSLIFIREYAHANKRPLETWWLVLLEVLALFFLLSAISAPYTGGDKYTCVLDDRLASPHNFSQRDKSFLKSHCREGPYLLSHLAHNEFKKVNFSKDLLPYILPENYTNTLSSLRQTLGKAKILIITGRDNYPVFLPRDQGIYFYPLSPARKEEQNAFRQLRVFTDPTDYSRKSIHYELDKPARVNVLRQSGKRILDSGTQSTEIIVEDSIENIVLEIENFPQSAYYLTLSPGEQIDYQWEQSAPQTIRALLQAGKSFPRFLLRENAGLSIGYSSHCREGIHFIQPVSGETDSLQLDAPFRELNRYAFKQSSCENENWEVITRFARGEAAVLRQGKNVCFCFDPDALPETLRQNPLFANWLLSSLSAKNHSSSQKVQKLPGFYQENKYLGKKPAAFSINEAVNLYAENYRTESMSSSGVIAEEKSTNEHHFNFVPSILILFILTLAGRIFLPYLSYRDSGLDSEKNENKE